MNKFLSRQAFTLVELLVVITIIGILAGIALPVFTKVQTNAQQTKVLAAGKQIGLGLKLFANDFDGQFPSKITQTGTPGAEAADSNLALANLVPSYVPSEKTFWVAKSKWCSVTPPDENYSDENEKLKGGENNFAYVLGLSDTSPANWPVLADGFAGNSGEVASGAAYATAQSVVGGVWSGEKAIVIRVDQSGAIIATNKTDPTQPFVPRDDDRAKNLFDEDVVSATLPNGWLVETKVLNPATATP